MELTFSYEVETINTKVNIGSVRFNEFITDFSIPCSRKILAAGCSFKT